MGRGEQSREGKNSDVGGELQRGGGAVKGLKGKKGRRGGWFHSTPSRVKMSKKRENGQAKSECLSSISRHLTQGN